MSLPQPEGLSFPQIIEVRCPQCSSIGHVWFAGHCGGDHKLEGFFLEYQGYCANSYSCGITLLVQVLVDGAALPEDA